MNHRDGPQATMISTLTICCALAVGLAGCSLGGDSATKEKAADPAFTISQTISDEAQMKTLAFSGLAFMTGNLGSQSFYPPGKVADYTGFQYLRDNDPDGMGHNTSFLTRVAEDVIHILDADQLQRMAALATAQQADFELYAWKRFPLMQAFRRLLEDDLPAGATGLSLAAVKAASVELYEIDGQISYDRARLYAEIIAGLTEAQKAGLDAMVGAGWESWPDNEDAAAQADVRAKMKTLSDAGANGVAIMSYAGDIFSWYAGSVEADVYFCPERQGTYFGSFFMKDAPAIGHEGYSIDTQLTATAGAALCDSSKGYVTEAQAAKIAGLVEAQRGNLYGGSASVASAHMAATSIVAVRARIAALLRSLRTAADSDADGDGVDDVLAEVLELSATYGELDGEDNYNYAKVFAEVYQSLGADQKTRLLELRADIMAGTYGDGTPFDFAATSTPYLYSAEIKDANLSKLETLYIADSATDAFFE